MASNNTHDTFFQLLKFIFKLLKGKDVLQTRVLTATFLVNVGITTYLLNEAEISVKDSVRYHVIAGFWHIESSAFLQKSHSIHRYIQTD